MKKSIFVLVVFSAVFAGSLALAQNSAPEVVYPVSALGGCADKAECFAFCEIAENQKVCLHFAKRYQLLPEDEIKIAEKVQSVTGGPGGCDSQASCHRYCDDVANINECIQFAEENGLMHGEELEEAKKIRTVLESGGKLPGGCKNKSECERYCEDPSNMDECLEFAEDAGFIPPEELEQARKFLPLMKSGETPGGCKSKNECEAYCEADANFEECISFAEKNGMIPEEERKNIEAFKRAGGKGPGGCRGRQCEAFCQNPDNQEACFTWAKENGILGEEELSRMDEGRKHLEKALSEAPPEVAGCLEEVLGAEGLEKLRSGGFLGGAAAGERMSSCFQKMKPGIEADFDQNFMPERRGEEGQFQGGPGRSDTPGRMIRPMPGSTPEGEGEYQEGFNMEYDRQFEGEFNEQYRREYDRQFEGRPEGFPEMDPAQFQNTQNTFPERGMMLPEGMLVQPPSQE